MRTQGRVRGVVLLARLGPEGDAHGDVLAVGGVLPVDRLVQHVDAGIHEEPGQFDLQVRLRRAHRRKLEGAGELEAVLGVVGFDFHRRAIMGAGVGEPKPPWRPAAGRGKKFPAFNFFASFSRWLGRNIGRLSARPPAVRR